MSTLMTSCWQALHWKSTYVLWKKFSKECKMLGYVSTGTSASSYVLASSTGHVIDKDGIHPTQEKVQAIKNAPQPTNIAPQPTNIAQLRSFLGLINYYSKFLPNLSATLTPLYALLNKGQKWQCLSGTQNKK